MSFIAIVGAGAIGGALAHRIAARDRVREVRLIDEAGTVAAGKALDIAQAAPIEGFTTRVTGVDRIEAAAGAAVVLVADPARGDGGFAGEAGLALVKRIAAIEGSAPLVIAGGQARPLIARAVGELRLPPRRIVGSAPFALQSAVRALAALEVNGTGADVQVLVAGVPPRAAFVSWDSATAFGQPLWALVPAHRLAEISARLAGLWPPGPQALASAGSRIAEAIARGSRRRFSCFVSFDGPSGRGTVAAMPVEVGPGGVVRVLQPALSRLEQTQLENALEQPVS